MDTKVNYVIVGLFTIVLTLIAIVGSIWIAGGHHTKNYNKYLTFVNEPVDGLTEKSAVKFNGVDVGFVDSMQLNPNNPQEVRLVLKLLENTPINQSTVATIRAQGLTGYTYLGLHAMKKTAPPLTKPLDEPYPIIPYSSSLFKKLDSVASDVSQNVQRVTNALSELLGEENQKYVRRILSNVAEVTKTLEENTEEMDSILQSTQKMMKNSADVSEQFDQTVTEFRSTLKSAKTATSDFSMMAQDAKQTFSSANRSIKDLGDQLLPNTYLTLEKLKRVMSNIENLTGEMNRNPSILVRGKKPKIAGPGE